MIAAATSAANSLLPPDRSDSAATAAASAATPPPTTTANSRLQDRTAGVSGRRGRSPCSVARSKRTANETARLNEEVATGRRPEMPGDPVAICAGTAGRQRSTDPGDAGRCLAGCNDGQLFSGQERSNRRLTTIQLAKRRRLGLARRVHPDNYLRYHRSYQGLGALIDSARRHPDASTQPCEPRVIGLPIGMLPDSLQSQRTPVFRQCCRTRQSSVVRSSPSSRSRGTVYGRESSRPLPMSADLSTARLVTSHSCTAASAHVTRGQLQPETDRSKKGIDLSISFLTALESNNNKDEDDDVIVKRCWVSRGHTFVSGGYAIVILSCEYRRRPCGQIWQEGITESELDPAPSADMVRGQLLNNQTETRPHIPRIRRLPVHFAEPADKRVSRNAATSQLAVNGTCRASTVRSSCRPASSKRRHGGLDKPRHRDIRFRRRRNNCISHSASHRTNRRTTARYTSGSFWLTFVTMLHCMSLLVGAANAAMRRQPMASGTATNSLLPGQSRAVRPSSTSNPVPVGASSISGSSGNRSPRSDAGISSGTLADGPGLPCIYEGHIKTDRDWYGYIANISIRSTGQLGFEFVYPADRCCQNILFYLDDQAAIIGPRMNCWQREYMLRPEDDQILRLTPSFSWSGCHVVQSADELIGDVFVCKGGRSFSVDVDRLTTWHVAVSNCATLTGIVLRYRLEVFGHVGECGGRRPEVEPTSLISARYNSANSENKHMEGFGDKMAASGGTGSSRSSMTPREAATHHHRGSKSTGGDDGTSDDDANRICIVVGDVNTTYNWYGFVRNLSLEAGGGYRFTLTFPQNMQVRNMLLYNDEDVHLLDWEQSCWDKESVIPDERVHDQIIKLHSPDSSWSSCSFNDSVSSSEPRSYSIARPSRTERDGDRTGGTAASGAADGESLLTPPPSAATAGDGSSTRNSPVNVNVTCHGERYYSSPSKVFMALSNCHGDGSGLRIHYRLEVFGYAKNDLCASGSSQRSALRVATWGSLFQRQTGSLSYFLLPSQRQTPYFYFQSLTGDDRAWCAVFLGLLSMTVVFMLC